MFYKRVSSITRFLSKASMSRTDGAIGNKITVIKFLTAIQF